MPDYLQGIVVGAVSLPVLAALLLWANQFIWEKVTGTPFPYDKEAKIIIALALSLVVFAMWANPDISPTVVAIVAFVYQLLLALKNVVQQGARSMSRLTFNK